MEIFSKVVELRSFSRAAAATYLTQPTVSEHIKALEESLGLKLLDRLGREVVPTRAGELLYGYARRILELQAEAWQALSQFAGCLKGRLILGGSTIPGQYLLPALVGRFKEGHPDVSVTLKIGDTREVVEGVLEGRLELGVVGARIEKGPLEYQPLARDKLALVVPAGHRWAQKGSVFLSELKEEPFVLRESGSGTRQTLEENLRAAGEEIGSLRVVAEMGSTEAIIQSIRAGLGVSVLSRLAVEERLDFGTLAIVAVEGLQLSREFFIVTHRARTLSPICQAFFSFLLAETTPLG